MSIRMKDIAKDLGVSIVTVSKVLRNHPDVGEEMRERVLARPGMTEEVCRLLPDGIGLIPLFLNVSRGTQDEFAGMMPHYEKLVAVLA